MYRALYRKWRPSVFDDVVGQEHITSILRSEVENGKLSHAYLFCGPRGTGKTTCAKIIAKAASCEHPENGNPCGHCAACLAIDGGTTTDIIEMDAASNNGVDNIRDLREGILYTPADLKYRVYIIDEVHMLSISAFNALLKTLEEPPEHVLFILATTELHKIPATVLSRCQRFDFHRVSADAIVGRLETVCAGEKISAERSALELMARLSQGGMRDALNMLEYCAGDGGTITTEKAERLLGASSRTMLSSLAQSIAKTDAVSALALLDEIYLSSRDIAVFWREAISFFRELMIALGTRMASAEDDIVRTVAGIYTLPRLMYVLDIMITAESDMQKNPASARLYAEMAVIRACDSTLSESPSALLERMETLENKLSGLHSLPLPEKISAPNPEKEQHVSGASSATSEKAVTPSAKENNVSVERTDKPMPASSTISSERGAASSGKQLRGVKKWPEIVRKLSASEGLFAPFLQAASAYVGSDGKFYIYFESEFAVSLMTEERRGAICAVVNAATEASYAPADILAAVRTDAGGIREPIDDLVEGMPASEKE